MAYLPSSILKKFLLHRIVFAVIVGCLTFFLTAQAQADWEKWLDYNKVVPHYAIGARMCTKVIKDTQLLDGNGEPLIFKGNLTKNRNYKLYKGDRIYIQSNGPRKKIGNKLMYYVWGGTDEGKVGNKAVYSGFVFQSDILTETLPIIEDNQTPAPPPIIPGEQLTIALVIPKTLPGYVRRKRPSKPRTPVDSGCKVKYKSFKQEGWQSDNYIRTHYGYGNSCKEYGYKGGKKEQNPSYTVMLYGLSGTYGKFRINGKRKLEDLGGGQVKTISKEKTLFYYYPNHTHKVDHWKHVKTHDKNSSNYLKIGGAQTPLIFQYGYVKQGGKDIWGWIAKDNLVEQGRQASANELSFTPRSSPIGSEITITVKDPSSVLKVLFSSIDGQGVSSFPITVLLPDKIKVNVPPGANSGGIRMIVKKGSTTEIIVSQQNFYVTVPIYDYTGPNNTHYLTIDGNEIPPVSYDPNTKIVKGILPNLPPNLPNSLPFLQQLYRYKEGDIYKYGLSLSGSPLPQLDSVNALGYVFTADILSSQGAELADVIENRTNDIVANCTLF